MLGKNPENVICKIDLQNFKNWSAKSAKFDLQFWSAKSAKLTLDFLMRGNKSLKNQPCIVYHCLQKLTKIYFLGGLYEAYSVF